MSKEPKPLHKEQFLLAVAQQFLNGKSPKGAILVTMERDDAKNMAVAAIGECSIIENVGMIRLAEKWLIDASSQKQQDYTGLPERKVTNDA